MALHGRNGNTSLIMSKDLYEELALLTSKLEYTDRVFSSFLAQAPIVLWCKDMTDPPGRMVFISNKYSDIWGISADDYRGKSDYSIWPREIADEFNRNDMLVMETGAVLETIENTNHNPREGWEMCRVFKFPMRLNGSDEITHVGGMAIPFSVECREICPRMKPHRK